MPSDESVSDWIASLKEKDEDAAQHLYERYIERLIVLARRRLGGARRRVADEEDIAQMAMNSFFRGAREGRFAKLKDRDDLWQILVMITERKAVDQMRRQSAKKRAAEVGESAFRLGDETYSCPAGIEQVMGREPSPEFAAEIAEELRHRMEQLADQELRSIAVWKMEGRTNEEIARMLGCVPRTVARKLELIRNTWQMEME